jgi:uncharacterized LabA/DUF88 family protein
MDLLEFKKQYVREELCLSNDYGRILAFVDFGNVNYWFENDRQDANNRELLVNEKLAIDLAKLKEFIDLFSDDARFYYGHDPFIEKSLGFIVAARESFGKSRVFTKQIQFVRHHLNGSELAATTRTVHSDTEGSFVRIPKCNFDVEISVDAVRLADRYDTICLFSSDADFVHLARYLKSKGKKVILVKGGHIVRQWKAVADIIINAQTIKKHITLIKPTVKHLTQRGDTVTPYETRQLSASLWP